MRRTQLILGGARSGKSRRALELARKASHRPVFIATAEPWDDEMAERIARHKTERGDEWSNIEAPLALIQALEDASQMGDLCVIDCLTLWLSNLMHNDRDVEAESKRLCQAISSLTIPVILVSNEVGLGLVPETPLGRAFRDAQGRLNQDVAKVCDRVEFIAAGLPILLKG